MSIMKRALLLEIESGKDTCQECEFRDRDADSCELFNLSLDDEGHRLAECVNAEGRMVEATIRCSTVKTADAPVVPAGE